VISKNKARYEKAMQRATAYLGTFSIDPLALREQGIKGRKKLVELLDAYVAMHRYAKGSRKRELLERFRQVAKVTDNPLYHDMDRVPRKQFHQDATSYLRACYLMEKMGLETRRYRKEIQKIKGRLDGHMKDRGPHQRMAFKHYYRHFSLTPPPELREPFKRSVTARRLNPYRLSLHQAYQLTHEIFVPSDYGGRLEPSDFSKEDRRYLRRALEVLTTIYIYRKNPDLVGELLASMRYLGWGDQKIYREGLTYILASQRPSGAFGNYERFRAQHGDRLELGLYLHTTSVVMDILPLAFEGPLPGKAASGNN
jgi:hypothetical protein